MLLMTPLPPVKLIHPNRKQEQQVRRYLLPKTIHKTHTLNIAPAEKTKTKPPTFPPPAASSHPIATTSTITSSASAKPTIRPRKSHSDLYSGASEDEYIPAVKKTAPRRSRAKQTGKGNGTASKPTKKVAGSNKQKAHSQLPDIPEEDEEEEGDGDNPAHTSSSRSVKKSVTHSSKGRNSTKMTLPDTPEKQQQPASKRARTTKAKASKPKTSEKASAPARGRAVKEEEDEEDPPSSAQSKQVAKKSASAKGKKRTAQEDEPSEDVLQPPQKRVKPSKQEEAKKANVEKSTNKKRPREDDAEEETDVHEKETKRKKLSNKTKDANSKSEVPAKKASKGAKSKAGTKAVAAKKVPKPTSTAYVFPILFQYLKLIVYLRKRKENSLPPEETQVGLQSILPCIYA